MRKIKYLFLVIATSFLFTGCGQKQTKKYCEKHDTFDENLCCVVCGEFHQADNGKGEEHSSPFNLNDYYLFGPYKLMLGKQYESDPWSWGIFSFDASKHSGTTVEIPTEYRGVPITFVNGPAFQDCTTIEHIIFHDNFDTNGGGILRGCTSLKSLTTSGYFDKYMFDGEIPSSLKEVKYTGETVNLAGEFDQYPSVEKITISKNVKKINATNFVGFTNLQNVYYEGTVADWCGITVEGNFNILNAKLNFKNSNNEYEELKNVVIPEGVTEIKENLFRGMKIESVVISDTVTKIGKAAFEDCRELKSVVLGKNVQTIEQDAFSCCFGIETVWYKGSFSSFNSIYVEVPHVQEITNKTTYYYDENPSLTSKLSGNLWHFNENGEPELWSDSLNVTSTVDGKTYKHASTEVVVSDEYWSMLQEAKAQGMLEMVLEADVLVLFNNSADKADYQAKLNTYYSNLFSVYTITFEDGKIKIKVDGQPAWPSEYIELNGAEIYEYDKVKYEIKDGKIYEQAAAEPEFLSVINVYEVVTE